METIAKAFEMVGVAVVVAGGLFSLLFGSLLLALGGSPRPLGRKV